MHLTFHWKDKLNLKLSLARNNINKYYNLKTKHSVRNDTSMFIFHLTFVGKEI
jgi:hypothetical protein